jgi:hypothetical protein
MTARSTAALVGLIVSACSSDSGTAASAQAKQLPAAAELCKLAIGYTINVPGRAPNVVLGTHSDDVRAILGEPETRTDTRFTYDWCVGETCVKHATAVFTLTEADRCYHSSGKPITPPYWVSDVMVAGFESPACWRVGNDMAGHCPECLPDGEVVDCAK